MKLDRNINSDGSGKYALVNLRKVRALGDQSPLACQVANAIDLLEDSGLLSFGYESPDQQFFVLKYGDKFTASALRMYACEARNCADAIKLAGLKEQSESLCEYAAEMRHEAQVAEQVGCRLPT
jgi:hypothetical protein